MFIVQLFTQMLRDKPLYLREVYFFPVLGSVERGNTLPVQVNNPPRPDEGPFLLSALHAFIDPDDIRRKIPKRIEISQSLVLHHAVRDLPEFLRFLESLLHSGQGTFPIGTPATVFGCPVNDHQLGLGSVSGRRPRKAQAY